ncbi:hypothetical protein KIN20_012034, partial [Parelaphostrongylus tenuis]
TTLKASKARHLTDPVIISLLSIISTVLGCGVVPAGQVKKDIPLRCIIVGSTVTGICTSTATTREMGSCSMSNDAMKVTVSSVPTSHTSISGTLSTTNIIMANWSRTMWQGVLNRAIRMSATGPFGPHFFSATATVGGN